MGTKAFAYGYSRLKPSSLPLVFFSLILLLIILIFLPRPQQSRQNDEYPKRSKWYNMVLQGIETKKIKMGLVNITEGELGQNSNVLHGFADPVTIKFERVSSALRWVDFYPEWIDEDEKWGRPSCQNVPMPTFEDYGTLDVVVARVPCGARDVFRLQVNLVVANLLVRSGWEDDEVADRTAYAVFISTCGPMWEIFRCDDMLWHEGDYWVYKPDLERLKRKVLMPVGSCQLATSYGHSVSDNEERKSDAHLLPKSSYRKPKEAYVTILHSSQAYVCGAIALAQSIILTNSTKDLILLADSSISTRSLRGLKASGWTVKRIERIRSPHARKGAYNEWNYSKLRVWELTDYDKVIFIDSDLIVLRNIDEFFDYPQLSAAGNDKFLFNSGVMLVEPSKCMFETLMEKRYEVASYNGGDQGFLNEMFTWWHRWPTKLNHLKIFEGDKNHDEIPDNVYAIHYLGLKPWKCYMDYDCNWDILDHHPFASDEAHRRWWEVYKAMPKRLQVHCALNKRMDARIQKWRGIAKVANYKNERWKIEVNDPRRHH